MAYPNDHSSSWGFGLLWVACSLYSNCLLRAVIAVCKLTTTALSDSLSFTLPGALHVLDALIGPELDCGGPDYWCQCVLGHVGPLELLVPSLGQLAAGRGCEGGEVWVALYTGITFISLSYIEREHNMPTHIVHLSDAQTNCQHNLILFLWQWNSLCSWLALNTECGGMLDYKWASAHLSRKLPLSLL